MMYFDEKLRRSMETAHVNRHELARATGESIHEVNRWIAGVCYPRPELLLPIAQRLGTTLEDLCAVDSRCLSG